MGITESNEAPSPVGRCAAVDGIAMIAAPGGAEKRLVADTPLRAGDKVLTGEAAMASLHFQDGTRVTLGSASTLIVDLYAFEADDADDAAQLSLEMGTFVIETGDLAIQPDVFLVIAGDSSLGLRCARIAAKVDPLGYDMVTLLPPMTGPLGEVLAHNKIGVQMLNRAWQTLRLGGGEEDVAAPLTLPSGVVLETYGGPGLDALLTTPAGGDDSEHPDAFQPFQALQDRFLERQFTSRQVFPGDGPAKTGDGDRMLEDAFEGTRFRLSDPDSEPSN